MENKKTSPAKYSLTYGLVNGSFGIILGLMLYALDMHYQNDPVVQIIAAIVGILIIMFGIIQFKKENRMTLHMKNRCFIHKVLLNFQIPTTNYGSLLVFEMGFMKHT